METASHKLSSDFVKKVAKALQEEELDIYTLMLYCADQQDLDFFTDADRERVKRIFGILSEDTKHHAELLKLIVEITAG